MTNKTIVIGISILRGEYVAWGGNPRYHHWSVGVALAATLLCTSGCSLEGPLSVRRVWFDYNTLNTPALYYDKIHHMPMDAPRVRQLGWMYGQGPGRADLPPDQPIPGPAAYYLPFEAPQANYLHRHPLAPIPPGDEKASPLIPIDEPPAPMRKVSPPNPDTPPVPQGKSKTSNKLPPTRTAMRTASSDANWRFGSR